MSVQVQEFYDKITSTFTYVVFDSSTRDAIIIDPVLDFDPASGRVWGESVKKVETFVGEKKLIPHFICETHVHADHLTGAQLLKKAYPNAKITIGDQIKTVQSTFQKIFNLTDFRADGHQFDVLLKDGQTLNAGSINIKVITTPGHTPACLSYLINDMLFTGDSIFMPDSGTGRCDFPNGSAQTLFNSIKNKIYALPDSTKIYVGHDYQPGGREVLFRTTVGEQKINNIHVKADTQLESFVEFRTTRDKTLAAPRLLLPSIQVNMDAGVLPKPESNGISYLKLPLRVELN